MASFAAVAIVILSFAAIQAEEFYLFRMLVAGLTNGASGEELFFLEVFLAPFFLAVVLNVVPDYVSLLETRYMILWMSRQRSSVRHMVLLLIDLAVTAAIGFMFIFGPYLLLMGSWPWEVPAFLWESIFTLSWEPFVRQTEAPFLPEGLFILLALGICFYSSFFTSVWVWLYALSGLAVRVVGYFGIGIRGLRGILDIESKPLRSMGFVSIALVSLLFLILPILR